MTNVMAIFQDVDKCIRCNGCTIACKREWNLRVPTTVSSVLGSAGTPRQTVKDRTRMAIKSQRRSDMGSFVRYSCWHCGQILADGTILEPPCATACPYDAIKKEANGAVSVNKTLCKPNLCKVGDNYPCEFGCQRGGYPKVGTPYEGDATSYMNKCTLCAGRAGSDADIVAAGGTVASALPTRATLTEISACAEKAHEPACVSSCPAKALTWDTRTAVMAKAETYTYQGKPNYMGDSSLFWGSKKTPLAPPKADPFIEDHVTPMIGDLTSKLILPTLVVGGIAALSARRTRIESGEEV